MTTSTELQLRHEICFSHATKLLSLDFKQPTSDFFSLDNAILNLKDILNIANVASTVMSTRFLIAAK